MEQKEVYCLIAEHLFYAYRTYSGDRILLVFADSIEEAKVKAEEAFDGSCFVTVNRITPTDNPQIFEI